MQGLELAVEEPSTREEHKLTVHSALQNFALSTIAQAAAAKGVSKSMPGNLMMYDELNYFNHNYDTMSCSSHTIKAIPKLAVFLRHFPLNYYHFMVNNLAALMMILDTIGANSDWKFLTYKKAYMLGYLDLLAVPAANVVEYDPCTIYKADEVIHVAGLVEPTQNTIHSILHHSHIHQLVTHFFVDQPKVPSVLIIDRQDKKDSSTNQAIQQQRQIENLDEVTRKSHQ